MLNIFNAISDFLDTLLEPASDTLARRLGDPPGTVYVPMTQLELQHLMGTGDMVSDANLRHMAQMGQIDLQETVSCGEAALAETMSMLENDQQNNMTWSVGGFGGF